MKPDNIVSIIIPVFNVYPYLIEALNSAVSQTYKNLEIIVVDDGSTDGSSEICDDFAHKDERIVVIHQQNGGLSAARNAGLEIASGEYIAFLDSDDAYHPDYIGSMLYSAVRENADMVLCKWSVHHTNGTMGFSGYEKTGPQIERGRYSRKESIIALVDGRIDQSAWNKMYKAELWNSVRFPDGHVYEDISTTYRILDACNAVYILDKPLYLNRVREGSITSLSTRKSILDWFSACSEFDSYILKNTPGLLTEEHLIRNRRGRVKSMIGLYGKYCKEADTMDKLFEKDLRKQIKKAVNEIGIKECSFQTKVLYRILCLCPCFIKLIYRMYYPIKRFVEKRWYK